MANDYKAIVTRMAWVFLSLLGNRVGQRLQRHEVQYVKFKERYMLNK